MKKLELFIIAFAFALSSCIPASQKELTDLRGEVAQMQVQFQELRTNNADLFAKNDYASGNVGALTESVRDSQKQALELSQRMSVLEENIKILSAQIKELQARSVIADADENALQTALSDGQSTRLVVLPSAVFQTAYGDYSAAKYDLAFSEFEDFMKQFPDSEQAPQAQFLMGEIMFAKGQWERAIEEYKKVIENYKHSDIAVTAKLKMALSLENLGDRDEALNIFVDIAKNHPNSSEALTAKEKIKRYNDEAQKR